jgi:hypothetical protein
MVAAIAAADLNIAIIESGHVNFYCCDLFIQDIYSSPKGIDRNGKYKGFQVG